jgi:pyruvate,water dikinase
VVRPPELGDVGQPVIVELGAAPPARVGGKAAGLARLVELGLPVPPAVVLPVGEELGDAEAVVALLGEPLAVRSSAVGEDAAERSAAGQYETLLGVRAPELAAAVDRVRRGTERARAYGGGGADEIAVVIQREVPATRAGVAFSRDPVTGADEMVVECASGRGDAVVSGEVSPDRYSIAGGRVRARAAGTLRTLRDDEVGALVGLVRQAEEGFGVPVDVEFCFERRRLWLLQCRPITTL